VVSRLAIKYITGGNQVTMQLTIWYDQCEPTLNATGEIIIFDDTFPHCAWNRSKQERIILYIDFKIPEDIASSLPPPQIYESSDDEAEVRR